MTAQTYATWSETGSPFNIEGVKAWKTGLEPTGRT